MKNRMPLRPSTPRPQPPVPPWKQPYVPPVALGWALYSDKGILPSQPERVAAGVHIAGHVNAILALGAHDLLVGTHTGGVWHLAPNPAEPSMSQAWALSNSWDNPDVTCLCAGPDGPGHAYVGCRSIPQSDVVLYEASATSPGAWQVVLRGAAYGGVNAIGLASGRRLVVATDTGVWWSAIPAIRSATLRTPVYSWQSARWLGRVGVAIPCTGLVMVNGAPVVSATAGGSIWYGEWDTGGALVMQQGFAGLADTWRSSLAICAGDPNQLWGVISRASGKQHIAAVVRSTQAGRSWQVVNGMVGAGSSSMTLSDAAGEQGDYNNCIAVSPVAPTTVLIGWQSGTFVSTDGGNTYAVWDGGGHLHSDVHAIYFDPRDPTGKSVFIGSDGGVAQTSDLGTTFTSFWNQFLANLQFSGTPPRNNYGTMTADLAAACRLGAGLQDNGVAWADARGPWHAIDGGDGAAVVFVAGGALVTGTASANGARLFIPSNDGFQGGGKPPMKHADGTVDAAGLPDPNTAAVNQPGPPGSGFYAVGALDLPPDANGNKAPDEIYGLRYTKPDGSDASWQYISTLPPGVVVWSLAAADSGTIYAGTWPAHIYKIDSASGQFTDLAGMPTLTAGQPDPNATITRIVVLDGGALLAVYNDASYAGGVTGQILHYSPDGTWTRLNGDRLDGTPTGLPGVPIFGLEVDPWGVLYATTDDRVYVADGIGIGYNWHDMSGGLPTRAHLGEVRFARYPDGGIALYLATWGRSVWEATWQAATGPVTPGRDPGPALAFNEIVGSLVDGRLYQVGPGGLQPVGPIDPELQLQLVDSAQAMTARANELAVLLTQSERDAGKALSTDQAVAQIRVLHNQLQRGLATLATVSAGPQQWAPTMLASLITRATEMVTGAAACLARQGPGALPDAVHRSVTELTSAVATHAKTVAAVEQAAGIPATARAAVG